MAQASRTRLNGVMTRLAIPFAIPLALVLGLAAVPAAAQQGWFSLFRNTPAEQFDDEDLRLFIEASRKALNDTPEQGTVSWENPKTQSRGDVTVLSVFTWQEHPCRKIKVVNEARGRKGTTTPSFCRVDDKWRVVTQSQLAK
jgi:surface antigen